MGVKDHTKHYDGIDTAGPPTGVTNAVSRHIQVGDRSFAQMVAQAGKGGTDSEQNLQRDLDSWASYLFHRWNVQSGWLRGQTHHDGYLDYTTETNTPGITDDSTSGLLIDGVTLVNSFILPRLEASVAGYPVIVEYTNTETQGYNLVELVEPRVYDGSSASIKRTDFVFLEVWLALVAPDPETVNKPSATQLFRHGNVLSPSGTWLTEDIIDPTLGYETAQRVQVQYRIRSTGSFTTPIDYKVNPDGFSSTIELTAWAGAAGPVVNYPFVPADGTTIWGNSSAAAYEQVDSGLWVAGDGGEPAAQALGALDGFVYAIPLCFVFRHNDCSDAGAFVQGFDPTGNTNGAPMHNHPGYPGVIDVIPAGVSDRPDNEFADVITQNQLLDLRRHVVFSGVSLEGEMQHQLQSLLDGSLRTWAIDSDDKLSTMGSGSGDVSTRPLICNEIGRGTSPPTGWGEFIRDFDHICRRFADQSVVERVVIAFYPGDRVAGAVLPGIDNPGKYVVKTGPPSVPESWYEGDVLHLDLRSFDATTLGGIFQGDAGGGSSAIGITVGGVTGVAPAGTVITDVLSIVHDDGHYDFSVDQNGKPTTIIGLGTEHIEITLDANDTLVTGGLDPLGPNPIYRMVGSGGSPDGSPRRLFVEVEITYPIGEGLTDTPDHPVTPDATLYNGVNEGPGPVIEVNKAQRPSDWEILVEPGFREGYREVRLEYVTDDATVHGVPATGQPIGSLVTEELVSADPLNLYFPRRVYDPGVGPHTGALAVTESPLVDGFPRTIDPTLTEYGSSSRKVVLDPGGPFGPLSGAGHTLTEIQYYGQDPVPNYGGAGYQVGVYYRTNAPQTAGVKNGNLDTTGDGTMPQTLIIEPLVVGTDVWTGQVGMGSVDMAFPYVAPLDQLPINDGPIGSHYEWYFTATASTTIDDFNANTGLLSLQAFVQADGQNPLQLGGPGAGEVPRTDQEFRSYYPYADETAYRPSAMSQPLYGAVRHKVWIPMLARATEDAPNATGGLLYRKDEVLLVVLTRFAELDEENTVRFTDVSNTTCAAIYRSRNLLLAVGR